MSAKEFLDFVQQGKYKDVQRYLNRQSSFVNVKSRAGQSALMAAAYRGHIKIANLLIEKGATVNDQGPDGSTAFIIACMNGRLDIAEVLMKAGADVTLIDEDKKTGFDYCDGSKNHWGSSRLTSAEAKVLQNLDLRPTARSTETSMNHATTQMKLEAFSHVRSIDNTVETAADEVMASSTISVVLSSRADDGKEAEAEVETEMSAQAQATAPSYSLTEDEASVASYLMSSGLCLDQKAAEWHAQNWGEIRRETLPAKVQAAHTVVQAQAAQNKEKARLIEAADALEVAALSLLNSRLNAEVAALREQLQQQQEQQQEHQQMELIDHSESPGLSDSDNLQAEDFSDFSRKASADGVVADHHHTHLSVETAGFTSAAAVLQGQAVSGANDLVGVQLDEQKSPLSNGQFRGREECKIS